ncbi:MAG: tol-pal system protein YbgF [Chelatococcus sp.]|uniref:tol-pal system protein YbgF n=1 Tax=Chelatococcus sp. TaxID=1953771 RepID=UPI0025C4DA2F|nr:tol-pal system protein YbgF [Chelatococcus sp.]MBX3538308.1 tol-pal system protein YbgF [Chelatococcus sp.]
MIRVQRSLLLLTVCGMALSAGVEARAQDASEMFVRLQRLEGQVRELSGRVEQLQFENRRLQDQTRKFQEDVDFRFQELGGKGGGNAAPQRPPQKRSDAFDPATQSGQPGAPRPLGQGQSNLAAADPDATGGIAIIDESGSGDRPDAPLDLSSVGRNAPPPPRMSVAATATDDPRTQYESAVSLLQRKDYESAEMGFRQFLQSHPRDRLVPDATYLLGESYLSRGRYREAAEQYLKVTTEYGKSNRAPAGMVKLAVSLNALGARDQACATLAEVGRKYPQADANVRQNVARERARVKCT